MPSKHLDLYANVHVLLWPWLWWQLARLQRWMNASQRSVLVAVDHWGNVYVTAVADAPGQGPRSFSVPVSARLVAALSSDIEECLYPRLRRDQQLHRDCPAAGASAGLGRTLPLPDT